VLQLKVSMGTEGFDEEKSEFVDTDVVVLRLEHSLVSLSKWEAKWEIPFLTKNDDKTREQVFDYIVMMNLDEEFPEGVLANIKDKHLDQINEYIGAKMTATTIHDDKKKSSPQIITSELIYYWMIAMEIPFECQYWHLARLMTLIQVVNAKNAPKKKMSQADAAAENRRLNAERRARTGSKG
jgi:hypothetical protein